VTAMSDDLNTNALIKIPRVVERSVFSLKGTPEDELRKFLADDDIIYNISRPPAHISSKQNSRVRLLLDPLSPSPVLLNTASNYAI
jgi:hypothetical protein